MSSCVSGAAAYTFELDMLKSPPSRTAASSHNTPSPSSTISESNSPPLAISTRRPRTQRKRPNQTYDEAEALLSTAYPNIFSSKRKSPLNYPLFLKDYEEASQLLLPYESTEETGFLFNPTVQTTQDQFLEHKEVSYDSEVNQFGLFDDFDAESILDEEIEEGIDSFMERIESNDGESVFTGSNCFRMDPLAEMKTLPWHGSSLGLKNSLRECDDASLWRFPTVELEHISPRVQTTITAAAAADDGKLVNGNTSKSKTVAGEEKKKKTKKKKKVAPVAPDLKTEQSVSLFLKLDYDGVLEAWSDKESPFSDEILASEAAGSDVHARLAEIDLFGDSGLREAIVLRYKEKRRNRLFSNSKRIRYQVRKLNADQRPRMKGRFVRKSNVRNLGGLRL